MDLPFTYNDEENQSLENLECPICYCPLINPVEHSANQSQCVQMFCRECVEKLTKCPFCRIDVYKWDNVKLTPSTQRFIFNPLGELKVTCKVCNKETTRKKIVEHVESCKIVLPKGFIPSYEEPSNNINSSQINTQSNEHILKQLGKKILGTISPASNNQNNTQTNNQNNNNNQNNINNQNNVSFNNNIGGSNVICNNEPYNTDLIVQQAQATQQLVQQNEAQKLQIQQLQQQQQQLQSQLNPNYNNQINSTQMAMQQSQAAQQLVMQQAAMEMQRQQQLSSGIPVSNSGYSNYVSPYTSSYSSMYPNSSVYSSYVTSSTHSPPIPSQLLYSGSSIYGSSSQLPPPQPPQPNPNSQYPGYHNFLKPSSPYYSSPNSYMSTPLTSSPLPPPSPSSIMFNSSPPLPSAPPSLNNNMPPPMTSMSSMSSMSNMPPSSPSMTPMPPMPSMPSMPSMTSMSNMTITSTTNLSGLDIKFKEDQLVEQFKGKPSIVNEWHTNKSFDSKLFRGTFMNCRLNNNIYKKCLFSDATLTGCDLSSSQFIDCMFRNCTLTGANLANAHHTNTIFLSCTLINCNMFQTVGIDTGINIAQYTNYKPIQFISCSITKTNFSRVTMKNSLFSASLLISCNFSNSKLSSSDFNHSTLTDCNYSQSELSVKSLASIKSQQNVNLEQVVYIN